jgi:hypothetical protein
MHNVESLAPVYLDATYIPVSVDQVAVVTALLDYLAGNRRPSVIKALLALATVQARGYEEVVIAVEGYVALAWRESHG